MAKKNKNYTVDEVLSILKMFETHYIHDIAKITGVTYQTLRSWEKKFNKKLKKRDEIINLKLQQND